MRVTNHVDLPTRTYTNSVKFDSHEEIEIFCRFFYYNDYFLKKHYQTLGSYRSYIISVIQKNGEIYADCAYHVRLLTELNSTIDNYRRKSKLQNISKIVNG